MPVGRGKLHNDQQLHKKNIHTSQRSIRMRGKIRSAYIPEER